MPTRSLAHRQPIHYAFVPVAGDGVHEIPVGPVHAGTIEPGHFRFSVVGERVLRLEERLGLHAQGHRKALRGAGVAGGVRLAGARQRRFDGGLRLGVCDGGRELPRAHAAAARAVVARAAAGARAHRQSSGRSWLPRQRRRPGVRPGAVLAAQGGRAAAQRARCSAIAI